MRLSVKGDSEQIGRLLHLQGTGIIGPEGNLLVARIAFRDIELIAPDTETIERAVVSQRHSQSAHLVVAECAEDHTATWLIARHQDVSIDYHVVDIVISARFRPARHDNDVTRVRGGMVD